MIVMLNRVQREGHLPNRDCRRQQEWDFLRE